MQISKSLVPVAAALALGLGVAAVQPAHGQGMMGGYGMGPGMMGGYGPGYGPGNREGDERGYGPGYGRGYGPGYGMGPGMMGGYGMGPGMMGGYGMGPGMMGGYGTGPGMMGYGGLYGLDLSAEQRRDIGKIQDELRKKNWDLMGKMHDEGTKLRDLYAGDKIDRAAVMAAYRRMSDLRLQVAENALEAREKMESVLTPEQRKELRRWGRGWNAE